MMPRFPEAWSSDLATCWDVLPGHRFSPLWILPSGVSPSVSVPLWRRHVLVVIKGHVERHSDQSGTLHHWFGKLGQIHGSFEKIWKVGHPRITKRQSSDSKTQKFLRVSEQLQKCVKLLVKMNYVQDLSWNSSNLEV